jgi:hypothetical protein
MQMLNLQNTIFILASYRKPQHQNSCGTTSIIIQMIWHLGCNECKSLFSDIVNAQQQQLISNGNAFDWRLIFTFIIR